MRRGAPEISSRAAKQEDEPFLRRLFETARAAEFALLPMNDTQKAVFVDMQFRAQRTHYRATFPSASFDVLTLDGIPIGNMTVDEGSAEICLIDIALLPEHRNKGVGTELVRRLLDRAAAAGKPVTLHVEVFNPARKLYERMGFQDAEQTGIFFRMRWTPAQNVPGSI